MWEYINDLDMELGKAGELVSIAYSLAVADEAGDGLTKGALYGLARVLSENVEKMKKLSDALWDVYVKEKQDREKKAKGEAA